MARPTAQQIIIRFRDGGINMASTPDITARENWSRYQHGRDRGHLDYMAQAARCEGMYMGAGEQWLATDKAVLTAQGRPSYEFNEIMPSINSAVGYQIHNRMDIAFKPRGESGDLDKATVLSKVIMQIADQSKLHWRETGVFSDGLIEQRGYYDVRVNFDSNIKGEIEIETLDPRDVIPDPDAKSYNPKDWSDVIVTRWLTLAEIEAKYGTKARDLAEASGDDDEDFGYMDGEAPRNRFGGELGTGAYDAYGSERDGLERYRVIDRQKAVFESTKCLVFPSSGDVKPESTMTPEQVQDALANGATYAKRMKRRVRWIVTTYSATLFDDYSPYEDLSIVPYFAYFRRGKTRGMVDNAIGPQEALNKAVSQYIHIINTSANSGWVIEENSLTNMSTDELNDVGARTGLVIEYRKGATAPAKIQPNSVPTGVDKMIQMATQALKEVTVPDAMRGNNGQEISGVAIQSRQFASQQQLAVPLDNLSYTRQLLAIKLVKLVQRYYDSHRVFRITETDPLTGKEVDTTLEINKPMPDGSYWNDITIGEYDVVITEQPMQVTFENSQFTQALEMRKAGVGIPDSVMIRYSNLTDKYDIAQKMQDQQPASDPLAEAKAKLIDAQTSETAARVKLVEQQAVETGVKAEYSAIQTAAVIAATPMTSGLADKLLGSVGFVDRNAAPIIPEVPQGMPPQPMPDQAMLDQDNTSPMSPPVMPTPGAGMMDGIETQRTDGVMPGEIGQ